MPFAAYNMPAQHDPSPGILYHVLSIWNAQYPVSCTQCVHCKHTSSAPISSSVCPDCHSYGFWFPRAFPPQYIAVSIAQESTSTTYPVCLSRLSLIWLWVPWACQPADHSHSPDSNTTHIRSSVPYGCSTGQISLPELLFSPFSQFISLTLCVHWGLQFSHQTQNHPNAAMMVLHPTQLHFSHVFHISHVLLFLHYFTKSFIIIFIGSMYTHGHVCIDFQ